MKKILIAVALLGLSSNVLADAKGELTSACSNYNSYKQNDSQGNWDGFVNNVNAAVASNETATKAWQVANSWKTAIDNNQFDGYCESDGNNSWKPIVPTTPTNPGGGTTGGVTKDELDASQQEQDDKQAAVDNAQNTEIDKKADQTALDKEVKDRTDGDTDLSNKIDKNKSDQVTKDGEQDQAITDLDNNKVDKTDQNGIDHGQNVRMDGIEKQAGVLDTRVGKTEVRLDTAEGAIRETNKQLEVTDKRSQNNAVRLDGVEGKNKEQDAKLEQHDQRITSNTQRIGSVEGRVSNLEQSTNKRFSDIDKRIGDNRKVASAGIAGAGAIANIPQVTQNGNVSIGAGIGGYDGEQAVAVGFSARVTDSVTTKVSVSTNTQSEVLWGAGVGVEW